MKQKFRFSTHIFHGRLFLEGMKRLRVIAIVTAVLSLTASALIPLVTSIETAPYAQEIRANLACVPTVLMVLAAPLFFLVLFSFLHSRKESDFFHAIPYSRTCVYVSFTCAALALVFFIQAASSLISGIMWTVCPYVSAPIGGIVSCTLVAMLAAALLCGFMMLALSVSGTPLSCLCLFALFAGSVRILLAIFLGMMETVDLIPTAPLWENSFLSPVWLSPVGLLVYMIDGSVGELLFGWQNILYSLIVTLALYVAAGFLYRHRRSEMAGQSAPGVRTQTLFRVLLALLPACLIPYVWVASSDRISATLVLVVGTLVVYFLYELITTKRAKNLLHAIPSLAFVAGGMIAFVFLFTGWRTTVLYQRVEPEDIRTVSLEANGFSYRTYQSYYPELIQLDDPEVLELVADSLSHSQDVEAHGERDENYWNRTSVYIRLKNGRTLHRSIILDKEQKIALTACLARTETYCDILFNSPEADEVGGMHLNLYMDDRSSTAILGSAEWEVVRRTFQAELAALRQDPDGAAKLAASLSGGNHADKENAVGTLYMDITGRRKVGRTNHYFSNSYRLDEIFPKTTALCLALWTKTADQIVDGLHYEGQIALSTQFPLELDTVYPDGTATFTGSLSLCSMTELTPSGVYAPGETTQHPVVRLTAAEMKAVVDLLKDRPSFPMGSHSTDFALTADTHIVFLELESTNGTYRHNLISGLFELDETARAALFDLLHLN